jgi:hypothetical protein
VPVKRQLYDDSGNVLDAAFDAELSPDGTVAVTLFSRHRKVRRDYPLAMQLIFARLNSAGANLTDALVDTRETRKLGLTEERRRIAIRDRPYPVHLSGITSMYDLFKDVQSDLKRAGLPDGAPVRAHSPGKQIRFATDLRIGLDDAVELLAHGSSDAVAAPQTTILDEAVSATAAKRRGLPPAGYRLSAEERRAMEDYSLKLVARQYENDGWKVRDTHVGNPYDLECTKAKLPKKRIEVKCTTGAGLTVQLTAGELAHARSFKHTVLAVVHHVTLEVDANGDLILSGGAVHMLDPWDVKDEELRPISYTYAVPLASQQPTASGHE